MLKYEPLTHYLTSQPGQEHALTFAQVEAIIVGRLPPSAYKHRAWWSNNPQGHVMAQAWVNAGWETSDVDMERRKLVFRRIRKPPPDDTGFSDRPQPPLQQGPHRLTVSGLDETTLSRLQARAELQGRSVEEVAREVLQRGAALTTDERLALADRTRAMSPNLHDIDIVAMIREDRGQPVRDAVIDANVAAALLLDLPYSARARDAIRSAERIIAPDIVVHEFTNVLWKLASGGRMTDGFARRALVTLDGLISDFVAGRPLAHDALRIAIEFTHPVYDCFYLALARQRDAILMTADRRLAARVAGSEFAKRLHLIEQ